ncbi:MAG: glycosyltransferase [Ekhidna sp.]|nr:glycosyltransferase [Ekhidna sp.]
MTKILIGMGTYKRPQMLQKTLEHLSNLEVSADTQAYFLLVDSEFSGQNILKIYKDKLPFEVIYIGDQPRGLVMMRNAILEAALHLDVDILGMIDDDILVSPSWMNSMVALLDKYQADVVDGAVKRKLPSDTPLWIRKGRFFHWHNAQTGSLRKSASTSNVFFRSKLIKDWGLRFDPFFNFCGGEDTFFFHQAFKKGAKIVWSNEVLSHEQISDAKITARWILQRAYRRTNSKFYRKKKEHGYVKAVTMYIFNAIFLLIIGIILFFFLFITGPICWLHSLRFIAKSLGYITAIFGIVYEEYRVIVGN